MVLPSASCSATQQRRRPKPPHTDVFAPGHASLQSNCQPRALHMTSIASRLARACLGTDSALFFWRFRPAQNYAPGQAYWNEDEIISGPDSPICRFAVGPRTACKFAARATPFFAGHRRTTGAGPSGLILASAPGVSSHAGLRGASPDYGSWSKWVYSSLGSRTLCQGHSVLPLPCENNRLSMGFCRDIFFFLRVRAYRRFI